MRWQVGERSECPNPLSCALAATQLANLYGVSLPALIWGYLPADAIMAEVRGGTLLAAMDCMEPSGVDCCF